VLFFRDFILSLSKDSFAQAKERTLRRKTRGNLRIKNQGLKSKAALSGSTFLQSSYRLFL
jgi:hypothetical protein